MPNFIKYFNYTLTIIVFIFVIWFLFIFPGEGYWLRLISSPDFFSPLMLFTLIVICLPIIIVVLSAFRFRKKSQQFNLKTVIGKALILGGLISIVISVLGLVLFHPEGYGGIYFLLLMILVDYML